MAITRRQFLKRTGAVAAGSLLGPSLFGNPVVRRAFADTIGDRYLVVVFLDGGNDGLNTVAPATNGGGDLRLAYDAARRTGNSGINISPSELAGTLIGNDPNTGAQLALHPGLVGLKQLYDLGKVAVVQGCGYPEYNTSHEQSRFIWQTADPLRLGVPSGWVGRYLAANYGGIDIPAVTISDSIAPDFRQGATSVLAMRRVREFGFPYDDFYNVGTDNDLKRAAFQDLYAAAAGSAQSSVKYLGDSGAATLIGSESYPSLHDLYEGARGVTWNPQYDAIGQSVARDLREVAKIMYGVSQGVPNVNARFFQVTNQGYDTHASQGGGESDGQHYALHRELGDSLKVFYDDCADMGIAHKVCVVVWSEFSRRVPQNGSGTDHGSQGPMFVIGGAVNGGVYGNHPNIGALDANGNTEYRQGVAAFRSTDFRDVYGTILKHWLNMPPASVSTVLPSDAGDPNFYWTVPNFDLGIV